MSWLLLAVGVAIVAPLAYWLFRIANPRSEVPTSADAVVVLAGGEGERLATAQRLVDDGVAPILVLSLGNGTWPGAEDLAALCDDADSEVTVVCVEPVPDSTQGEAATIAAEAATQGWRSLVLVTSDYHLHRATVWFDRCVDADVIPVAAPASFGRAAVFHELGALVDAQLLERSCN